VNYKKYPNFLVALIIFLQGALPFLHAHSGMVKQTGFHLHLPVVSYEKPSEEKFSTYFVNYVEVDSPEIGISTLKDKDLEESLYQYSFGKLLFVLWVFGLIAIQLPFIFKGGSFYKFLLNPRYKSPTKLPPVLAPPANL
jgi:hypothetical protein